MGYRFNRLDEPVFMAVPKPTLTEIGIHFRLESCGLGSGWLLLMLEFFSLFDLFLIYFQTIFASNGFILNKLIGLWTLWTEHVISIQSNF